MGSVPSCVLGRTLIQGGEDVLDNPLFFEKYGITHVVGICHRTVTPATVPTIPQENILFIELEDEHSSALLLATHFEETTRFIHNARRQGGNVFVHCSAGISRSSTITLAYLLSWIQLDLTTSIRALKSARNVIRPNDAFREQLTIWEASPKRQELRAELLAMHGKEGSIHSEWETHHAADLKQLIYLLWADDGGRLPLRFIGQTEAQPFPQLADDELPGLKPEILTIPKQSARRAAPEDDDADA